MELHEALNQIAEIRRRVAETELFRGYRALPVAGSGALAILAALVQPALVPDPLGDVGGYLRLWIMVAGLSIAINAIALVLRCGRGACAVSRQRARLAVGQFAPCVLAGALLTIVVARRAEDAALLPGLWQVIFSLGLFASMRLLPSVLLLVAVWYLTCGLVSLELSRTEWALSPWLMGLPYGIGQLLTAAILYWNLERHEQEEADQR